jgi:hypothetical protein
MKQKYLYLWVFLKPGELQEDPVIVDQAAIPRYSKHSCNNQNAEMMRIIADFRQYSIFDRSKNDFEI